MTNIKIFKSTNGEAITTSKNVAEVFSKPHKNVLYAIRKIYNEIDEGGRLKFKPTYEKDSQSKLQPGLVRGAEQNKKQRLQPPYGWCRAIRYTTIRKIHQLKPH